VLSARAADTPTLTGRDVTCMIGPAASVPAVGEDELLYSASFLLVMRPFPVEELLRWIGVRNGVAVRSPCLARCNHVTDVFVAEASVGMAVPCPFSSAMIGAAVRKQSTPTGIPQ